MSFHSALMAQTAPKERATAAMTEAQKTALRLLARSRKPEAEVAGGAEAASK